MVGLNLGRVSALVLATALTTAVSTIPVNAEDASPTNQSTPLKVVKPKAHAKPRAHAVARHAKTKSDRLHQSVHIDQPVLATATVPVAPNVKATPDGLRESVHIDKSVLGTAAPPCSRESAAALFKTYGLKGWDIAFPSYQSSITGDAGCWRTKLAEHGFGVSVISINLLFDNLLDHYVPPPGKQEYAGDRLTAGSLNLFYLTYDLSRYGVPDGQLQGGVFTDNYTWTGYSPNAWGLSYLAWYQTLFNKRVEVNIGYLPLLYQFVGSQLGGNPSNVLGPSSTQSAEVGMSSNVDPAPAAIARWHIGNGFYNTTGVSRSAPSTAVGSPSFTSLQVANASNPQNILFSVAPVVDGFRYPTERPLYIEELGYKVAAQPDQMFTWLRVTGIYNTTQYENLQNTKLTTPAQAVLAYADRQIWQSEPGSPDTAYKGIYIGGTAGWSNPKATTITQDYVARIYAFGMFGRPHDQISATYEHEIYSPYVVDGIPGSAGAKLATTCPAGVTCAWHAVNQYTVSYNAQIIPGMYLGLGASYADHPTMTYSPNALAYGSGTAPVLPQLNVKHSLNFLASLYINL